MFTITIPIVAIGKGRPRVSKAGHVYTPKETRDYEEKVARMIAENFKLDRFTGPVFVDIRVEIKQTGDRVYPTVKPDLDNVVKALLDAMNKLVYQDDAQICSLTCEKFYGEADSISIVVGDYDKVVA